VQACLIDSDQWVSIAAIHQDHLQEGSRVMNTLGAVDIKPFR
jgi:hypothetical protein